ncbi:MAG: type II secretion system protein [Patescibacteria group bacterium]
MAKRTNRNQRLKKGFTLLEVMVAILILMSVIIVPLEIASKSIKTMRISKDRIIAFYLAQEALEYIRNKRDTNWIQGNTGNQWLKGTNPCQGANGCYIDVINDSLSPCGGSCPRIRYSSANNRYDYDAASTLTPFQRVIKRTDLGGNAETRITVTVSWNDAGQTNSVILEGHLNNWMP